MKIKLRTTERTIKLRDRKQSAERAFRRLDIRRLMKSSKNKNPEAQTVEADATDTSLEGAAEVLQKVAPLRRMQQLRRSKAKSKAQENTTQPQDRTTQPQETTQVRQYDPDRPAEQSPTSSTPLQKAETKTKSTASHRLTHSKSAPAPQEILSGNTHIREAQSSIPKINATEKLPVRGTASTIQPKQAEHIVKQHGKAHSRKRNALLQQVQTRKAAAAKAAAVRKQSKGGRIASVLKSVLRGAVKSVGKLGAWLFGGAAGLLLPLIAVLVLVGLFCTPFAIFFSGETDSEMTVQSVMAQLNTEFSERIAEIENTVPHDDVQQTGTRASQKDVLAVYAVKATTDPENALDVATMDAQRAEILRQIFWDMNQISHSTETYTEEETTTVTDEDGNESEETQTVERTRLLITISGKTAQQIAAEYGFTQEQLDLLAELLSDEYEELWYGLPSGGGSNDIVQVALSQIGNVGGQPYWSWYGYTSRVAWCACFVSWCGNQCGYIDAGIMPKFSYCDFGIYWFQQRGQWQDRGYIPEPGCLIFFDWNRDGVSDHVGIVEYCDGAYVHTIEGNTSGDVCKQNTYSVGYTGIVGYGLLG